MAIPFDLKQAIETGSAILFVGAGMGHNMVGDDGKPIPDGPTLANMIAEEFNVPSNGVSDLPKIAQFVIGKMGGRRELCTFIRGILEKANPDEAMMWIPTVRWKAIFTNRSVSAGKHGSKTGTLTAGGHHVILDPERPSLILCKPRSCGRIKQHGG